MAHCNTPTRLSDLLTGSEPGTRGLRGLVAAAAAAALLLGLAACGQDNGAAARTAVVAPPVKDVPAPAASLIDRHGSVQPVDPRAVPVDPAVRTVQGRYATRQMAAALEQAMPGDVLVLAVDCCGAAKAERAVNIAFGIQAARDFSDDVPVLVSGPDLRTAAIVVDRLAAAGMSRVWLVTQ